jgi:hypothetical protein
MHLDGSMEIESATDIALKGQRLTQGALHTAFFFHLTFGQEDWFADGTKELIMSANLTKASNPNPPELANNFGRMLRFDPDREPPPLLSSPFRAGPLVPDA